MTLIASDILISTTIHSANYISNKSNKWNQLNPKVHIFVRKTGPRSNKIKQMQKQNTKDTQYKRDTDLRGSPSVGYVLFTQYGLRPPEKLPGPPEFVYILLNPLKFSLNISIHCKCYSFIKMVIKYIKC